MAFAGVNTYLATFDNAAVNVAQNGDVAVLPLLSDGSASRCCCAAIAVAEVEPIEY